jgi:transposase InsO family protein
VRRGDGPARGDRRSRIAAALSRPPGSHFGALRVTSTAWLLRWEYGQLAERVAVSTRQIEGWNFDGRHVVSRIFAVACQGLRLAHRRTRPYTPRTNGKAERFIQTMLREWTYSRPYTSSLERQAALPGWLHYDNRHRRHGSLQRRPPISRVISTDNVLSAHT